MSPNICILLDVGTECTPSSLFHLWRAFDRNSHLGGACGEIGTDLNFTNIWNPLVAAQNFEYKISNIIDKPFESMVGYIQVLPGAFSAYRYAAIADYDKHKGPLASYFHGELLNSNALNVFSANMYLAEDRILCFEVFTKKRSKWVLKYVKSAKAKTDIPKSLPGEIKSVAIKYMHSHYIKKNLLVKEGDG